MSISSIYWRGWSEQNLASFQQDQGRTNHCAKYAAASTINMLYGTEISGDGLVEWVESRFLKGTGKYSIFGNKNGSFVYQTANLIRKLSTQNGLMPRVSSGFGTMADVRERISDSNSLTLISVTYLEGREPVIARGHNSSSSLGSTRYVGGHLMVLVAYDPGHLDESGTNTPWGFLSSWPNMGYLYWMTEADFSRTWGSLSFFNIITVQGSPGI